VESKGAPGHADRGGRRDDDAPWIDDGTGRRPRAVDHHDLAALAANREQHECRRGSRHFFSFFEDFFRAGDEADTEVGLPTGISEITYASSESGWQNVRGARAIVDS
jgi:hypothetical protein